MLKRIFIAVTMIGLNVGPIIAVSLQNGSKIIQAASSQPISEKKFTTIIFDLGGVLVDEKQVGGKAFSWHPSCSHHENYLSRQVVESI